MSITLCPTASAELVPVGPSIDNLSYSFGLPGGAYCVGLARVAVRQLLQERGLAAMAPLAELVVSELLGCAYRFTPDSDVSLSLRCRYEVLRATVFDQHPAHEPQTGAACRERRIGSLPLLATLMDACGGDFGVADAEPPLTGVKSWAVIPMEGAYRYALL
ncbi:ATP-binding protein [Streptomyces sp. ISL-99]|uniref:ATP-binding protein n=1 Tax=Streptomyces sp. ISL-99 TaxID=2819193 RepID=UPI001BE82CAB|nr:ATP-binding protein [Streptomyces sp. ISL-99]MBT2526855.1 ATP-binding protein [Streptomyces sp. ISL-99]